MWITLIPTRRNDGSPVTEAELLELIELTWNRFSGCTVREGVRGVWRDPEDGQVYHDPSWELSVTCDDDLLPEAEELVREIGRRLEQKAMFMEIRYFDGVRILRTED